MVKALRLTLHNNIPYERVTIYSNYMGDVINAPQIFEDAQLLFECKHGRFIVPDYNIILIQLHNRKITSPNSFRVSRILLSSDLNFQNCNIIQQQHYADCGVPQIFREYEQLSFTCNDGLFVTTDFNVQVIEL